MRYFVLACDYDGTLAHHSRVSDETLAALARLRATGRRLLLVTGRELDDLLAVFPQLTLFEWVVAENGALLYRPSSREEKALAEAPPQAFVAALQRRGVGPISVGRVIVATWQPHESAVLETIREQGLELQVIFNKGAVMILPAGVTKATGLTAALLAMGLSPHEAVGVGDAENDHAFLSQCECSVAVGNALPAVKDRADLVTRGNHGMGVTELIDALVRDDLAEVAGRLTRHQLLLGSDDQDQEVRLAPCGAGLLIAGPSASANSTTTTSLLERLAEHRYQFCVIDPKGDYEPLESAISLGTSQSSPPVEEVLQVLARPDQNVVVNLLGVRLADRPAFFMKLLPPLLELRARTGRPHWLVMDEAHHLLPKSWKAGAPSLAADLKRAIFITVQPDQVHPAVLSSVGTVLAVGGAPEETLRQFCKTLAETPPGLTAPTRETEQILVWRRQASEPPRWVRAAPSRNECRHHTRKYAEGDLAPNDSFYFRGPEGKLNLRAQNLLLFLQMANGVDDQTWLFHLGQGDYSHWFREHIKDDGLAAEAEAVERRPGLSPSESRTLIREAVERRYTLAAASR